MDQQTLDPQAVNLAKAIRQTESGGDFSAKGKSGEYGAYQYTQPTWAKDSAQFGVNVPLNQATPEQQNEVAYKKIKGWKDQGYNVGQISSMWNAGEGKPNAYLEGNSGTNSSGVHYDTAAYAKSVANAYQKLKGGQQVGADPNNPSSTVAPQPDQSPSLGGFLGNALKSGENFVGGVANAVMHPIQTVGNLGNIAIGVGEQGLNALGGKFDNTQTKAASNVENFYKQRYGGLSNIGNTLYNDPVGAAADASVLLGGAGSIAGKLGDLSEAARAGAIADAGGDLSAVDAVRGSSGLSKAASGLNKAADMTNPLALPGKAIGSASDALKNSSAKSYEDALAATTKENKFLTKPVLQGRDITLPSGEVTHVPGLIERGKVGSLQGLQDTAYQGIKDTNAAYQKAETSIPGNSPVQVKPIIDQLETAKQDYMIKGAKGKNVVVDQGAVDNLQNFQDKLTEASKKGLISKDSLTEFKGMLAKKVARAKGYTTNMFDQGSMIDTTRSAAKAIRNQLDSQFPDIAKINAERSFWEDANKVIKSTVERKVGQSGIVSKGVWGTLGAVSGIGGGVFGSAAGVAIMEGLRGIVTSPTWRTVSSVVKDRLANALASNQIGTVSQILKSINPAIRLNQSSASVTPTQ